MREGGHDPGVLCLEVAEGALEAAPELAVRQLAALNELGITLAIDDFGTGTSSSITLSELPIHILKIDPTLVSRLGRDEGDVDSVSDAVELGHALGLRVVAEGVETDAQLAQLRRSAATARRATCSASRCPRRASTACSHRARASP